MDVRRLPVFMHDSKDFEILNDAKSCIPKSAGVYLVGGSVRNALFFEFFNERLPQRDYDLVVIGNKQKFIDNLRSVGFVYGKIRRKAEVVLKKRKVPKPSHEFGDYLFLDLHFSDEPDILKNLESNSNFTINGSALSLKDVASEGWRKKVVSLPNALGDLKDKRLRVNVTSHPSDFFSCLRFMSKGFKRPSPKEVCSLLVSLSSLEKPRYKKNIKKVFDYVGGEEEARKLVHKLGVKEDVFDFDVIKKLRSKTLTL